jgi:hypothetical protein
VRRATPRAVQVYLLGGDLLLWLPRAMLALGAGVEAGDWHAEVEVRTDWLLEKLRGEGIEEEFVRRLFGENQP